MNKLQQTEPALATGGGVAVLAAALVALLATFVDMTPEQATAVTSLIVLVSGFVGSWLIRRQVYSPATVAGMSEDGQSQLE